MRTRTSLGYVDADEERVADCSVWVSCWLPSVGGCYVCESVGACAVGYTTWMYAVTGEGRRGGGGGEGVDRRCWVKRKRDKRCQISGGLFRSDCYLARAVAVRCRTCCFLRQRSPPVRD